jgi:hypothetical protein
LGFGALNFSTILSDEAADKVGDGGGGGLSKACCSGLSVAKSSSAKPPGGLGVSSRLESATWRGGGVLGPREVRVISISPARALSMVYDFDRASKNCVHSSSLC